MTTIEINEELRVACFEALENMRAINEKSPIEESLIADLEFVLSSYEQDGNPAGLYAKGSAALLKLHAIDSNHPSLVKERSIVLLKKALEDYAAAENLQPIHHVVEF